MKLFDILNKLDINTEEKYKDINIYDISCDSKLINKSSLFIALNGTKFNGNVFINDAKKNGAVAVLTDEVKYQDIKENIFYIKNLRLRLSQIAYDFYRNQPSNIIAVTGTNGKTSVVNFCKQLWDLFNQESSVIGTLGIDSKIEFDFSIHNTTPDIITMHKILRILFNENIDNVALEASSHGIDQKRLDKIKVNIAIFTNLSQDHLDYHGDMESYFLTKTKLFTEILVNDGIAVINSDDIKSDELILMLEERNIKYIDFGKNADYFKILELSEENMKIKVNDEIYEINTSFVAEFEKYNLLAAMVAFYIMGFDLNKIVDLIPKIKNVKGRMHKILNNKNLNVYVDFAHTPNALKNVLKELNKIKKGELVLIFGCGGERDKGKREIMAKIAHKYADRTYITDDNPRNESAEDIRKDILKFHDQAIEIAGRDIAIKTALENLLENDILLIAGKGHEDYQIIGEKKYDFSDIDFVKKCLE